MSGSKTPPVRRDGMRLAMQGLVRVKVTVRREDAGLMRQVAAVLLDPARQAAARRLLRCRFDAGPASGLKALLAAAPLEGIDLARSSDRGRDDEL